MYLFLKLINKFKCPTTLADYLKLLDCATYIHSAPWEWLWTTWPPKNNCRRSISASGFTSTAPAESKQESGWVVFSLPTSPTSVWVIFMPTSFVPLPLVKLNDWLHATIPFLMWTGFQSNSSQMRSSSSRTALKSAEWSKSSKTTSKKRPE